MNSSTEKQKLREEAIRNGGFYNTTKDGSTVWNSIVTIPGDNRLYRERVETLIIKDGKEVYVKKKPNGEYYLPGGSTEKDCSHMDQAVNECREEAHINVCNIESTGITYKKIHPVPTWAKTQECTVEWNGSITEVYTADYDSIYKGKVDKEDEDPFILSGRFYPTKECFSFFSKEHRDALLWYIKNHQKTENVTESYISNYFRNKRFLRQVSNEPEVTRGAIDQIIDGLKKSYSDLSTKSKIQRERKSEDVGTIFHPVLTLDFSDGNTISFVLCFDDSSVTDGAAIHTDEYGDLVVIYPCFFKQRKENQVFTLLHEIGHIRLDHLDRLNSHHKFFTLKDNTNEYRNKLMKKGKVMYPEVNADLYAILSGAKLYTILNAGIKKDMDDIYDYRFTNQELANRYNSVFNKYSKLKHINESDETITEISPYSIANLAIHDMVYENESVKDLSDSDKDQLYALIYEFGLKKMYKNDSVYKEKCEEYKSIKNSLCDINNSLELEQAKLRRDKARNIAILECVKDVTVPDIRSNNILSHANVSEVIQEKSQIYSYIYESMVNVLKKLHSPFVMSESVEKQTKKMEYIRLLESVFAESGNKYKNIEEDDFGIPETRSFPLDTREHVISAYKLFGHADDKYKEELAKRIFKKMKQFDIPKSVIGPKSKIYEYIGEW